MQGPATLPVGFHILVSTFLQLVKVPTHPQLLTICYQHQNIVGCAVSPSPIAVWPSHIPVLQLYSALFSWGGPQGSQTWMGAQGEGLWAHPETLFTYYLCWWFGLEANHEVGEQNRLTPWFL